MAVFPPALPLLLKPRAARLDWSKPLTRGLVLAAVCHEGAGRPRDLVQARAADLAGATPATWTSGRTGPTLNFTQNNGNYYGWSTVPKAGTTAVSFAMRVWLRTRTANNRLVSVNAGNRVFLLNGSDTSITFYNNPSSVVAAVPALTGRWATLVLTYNNGSTRIYCDGVLRTTSTAITGSLLTGNWLLGINAVGGASTDCWDGLIDGYYEWNRTLTPTEVAAFTADPLTSVLWRPMHFYTGLSIQFARPNADTSLGTWTDQDGGSLSIYTAIAEPSSAVNDADYIQSALSPASDTYTAPLSAVGDPQVSTGHIVRYRYRKDADTGDAVSLVVTLLQGATTIASWTHSTVDGSLGWVTAEQTLTAAQADAITDYSALSLQFTASSP